MTDYPVHLEIETTNVCQLSCLMCPHRIMKRKQGFMSWQVLRKIMDESRNKAKTCYMHMIGEPLLHPEIVEMIKYVSSCRIRTSISTNSLKLDEQMCKELFVSGLDELTLALDSLKKDVYERLRAGGDFETVMRNIDVCLDIRRKTNTKTKIELQCILMKENIDEIEDFKKIYSSKIEGIGKLLIKQFSTFAGHVSDRSPSVTPPRRFTCGKLNNSTAIQWNGDVVICCRDYEGFTKVGNVLEKSIKQIWTSEQYNFYRKAMKEKKFDCLPLCKNC